MSQLPSLINQLAVVQEVEDVMPIIVRDIFTEIRRLNPDITRRVRRILQRRVPVRSGKLLDTLLNTLHVELVGNQLIITAQTPAGYPVQIVSSQHTSTIGYGPKYTPLNNITNRTKLRETEKGAYYLLNDPESIGDYETILQTYIEPIISRYIERISFNYTVTIRRKTVLDQLNKFDLMGYPFKKTITPQGETFYDFQYYDFGSGGRVAENQIYTYDDQMRQRGWYDVEMGIVEQYDVDGNVIYEGGASIQDDLMMEEDDVVYVILKKDGVIQGLQEEEVDDGDELEMWKYDEDNVYTMRYDE